MVLEGSEEGENKSKWNSKGLGWLPMKISWWGR